MNSVKHLTEKFFRTTAMPFRNDTSVLYYNHSPKARWSQRQYLLYPVRMYRVVAPRVSSRKVNILEKAVLGMCRAGITEAAKIGHHLDIGKDLTALIISQLADRYYVDSRGNLTQKGKKVLEDETSIVQDVTAGFIFQDPWTGDLFPRFAEREEYADVRLNDSGFPELILGTTGKPNYQWAFMPEVKNTIERQPSPNEIIKAVREHERTLKNVSRIKDDDDDDDTWVFEKLPTLDRVSFINEEPTDLWLATCIYVPEDISSGNVWKVYDPFGLGDSPWLLRKLEKHRKNQTIQGLENFLLNMLGDQRKEQFNNLDDWLILADREACLQVEDKLTPAIRKWEELFDDIVALERLYIEAEEVTDCKILLGKLEDILTKSQKVAERLLKMLQQDYPTKGKADRLSDRRELNRQPLNDYAENAGFRQPLPPGLLSVDRNLIRKAADYGHGSLRALMLATLLATPDNSTHPLRLAAQQYPDLLDLLDELAEKRNAAAHSSNQRGDTQPRKLADLARQIDTVYRLVAGTLQLSYQP
ncbi:hypothetical protein QUB36_08530 [Microcoleus sp. AT8-B1]|uniref:hypothetical protein n=1 Tax=unclassified Microcoleus TaxID=2642155 RepID=UPI002FD3804C